MTPFGEDVWAAAAGIVELSVDSAVVNIGLKFAARRRRPDRDSRSRRHTVNGCDLGRQRRDGHTERGRGQLTVRDVGSAGDVADHPNRRVAPRAAGRIVAGSRWVLAERTITVGEPPRRRP
jgi:hypothetical protein